MSLRIAVLLAPLVVALRTGRKSQKKLDGWGVPPENSTEEKVHCRQIQKLADAKVASGEWPIDDVQTQSRVNCVNGRAGSYSCSGVDFLGHISLNTFGQSRGNDIWGWTDPETQREYAIMGVFQGTVFADVTDPVNPVYIVYVPSHTSSSTWRDIKVYNNRAYIVSEASGHGMQVYDLTRLRGRTAPAVSHSPDYHFDYFGNAHNIVINEETARAYAVGARQCSGGLVIIDISQPAPVFLGCYSGDGYTHDAECVIYRGPDAAYQGKEICFAYNENTLTIVDVSTATRPTQISRMGYNGSRYTHQGWLDENQEFAYMNDELDEGSTVSRTTTYIVDVRSLRNPAMYSTFRHSTTAVDHNNYIVGGYVYQANYAAGFRVLRIKSDHTLEEAGYFVTPSAWSVYPYFPSGNVVVSSIPGGLFVLRPATMAPTPAPAPTPRPTGAPPSPPTPTPTPPTPTPSPGGCEHEKDCDVSPWCSDAGFETWCRQQGQAGVCPAPYCRQA